MAPNEVPYTHSYDREQLAKALQVLAEATSLDLQDLFFMEDAPEPDEGDQGLDFILDEAGRNESLRTYLPEDDNGVNLTPRFLVSAIGELNSGATVRDSHSLYTPGRYLARVEAIDDVHAYNLQGLLAAYTLQGLRAAPRDPDQMEPFERYRVAVEKYEKEKQRAPTDFDFEDPERWNAYNHVNSAASELIGPERHFQLEQLWNGVTLRFALISGFSHLALNVALKGEWVKDYPPYFADDLAVEVEWVDRALTLEEARAASQAYQYSLETSLGLKLKPSERTPVDELPDFEDEQPDDLVLGRIRPLRDGPGQDELHSLYLRATATTDLEVQHLFFTKVVEYVSQTVVRRERNESVRRWLTDQRALQPDAVYIEGLATLVGEQDRRARDDLSALKLTVAMCCDALLLAPHAPRFLKLASVTSESSRQERRQALEGLAETIHSTRNEIAHAKANYKPTGNECPPEDLGTLVGCMRQVAQLAIAWYSEQPASLRVHR